MPKIKITNPRNVIEAPIKKNYFKIRATSGPKGDKGDTGATGPQGPQGPQGNAATIYVGSTTTLPVGQDATVENVGSQYAAVLNFGIPQGPQGPQGAKGDKGDKGDKGEQGNTGNTGPAGQNATVYIGTTTTGAPGSQASVYNSGTENNAVLNFTIPQGQKGDTGATGATGPQGPAGQDGKDFAPSVVDSLPAVGEESKLYLTPKNYTTGSATGNPITISLGEDEGKITDFQLDGDTFQQSYEGKNLLNCVQRSEASQGITCDVSNTNTLTVSGKSVSSYANLTERFNTSIAAGTFTFVINQALMHRVTIRAYYEGGYNDVIIEAGDTYKTFTMSASIIGMYIFMATGGVGNTFNETFTVQLVAGSTPDYDFEPFVDGIASPNPSYPQQIQTVTGTQTVSINGTDYPIDLGDIKLCGLGDDGNGNPLYKDYIYPDGSDWKVHKATTSARLDASISWSTGTFEQQKRIYYIASGVFGTNIVAPEDNTQKAVALSSHFSLATLRDILDGTSDGFGISSSAYMSIRVGTATTADDIIDILRKNTVMVYAALRTPTDTVITDSALIAQLEAVRNATLQASNTITNTATGTNLAGDMEVEYYEYDPTNRYDKWLWLDINNAYEKLGS